MSPSVLPEWDEFRAQAAESRVVPLTRRLLADHETPVGLYRKLANGPGTFLFESAGQAGLWSRYSFIGIRSVAMLTEQDGVAQWHGDPPAGIPRSGDPTTVVQETIAALAHPRRPDLPPLTSGLVGYLSYDLVRRFERLPSIAVIDVPQPELALLLTTELAVLDHRDGSLLLVANVIIPPDATDDVIRASYERAVGRLEMMTSALGRPAAATPVAMTGGPVHHVSRTPAGAYEKAVLAAKEAIRAGECFQIVLSQRFEVETHVDALDVYRVLRATNPSPYMYLLRFPGFGAINHFDIVGSSPEAHIKVQGRTALLRPIAGTRPRGDSPAADAALTAALMADPKERAEHVMLVDLVRNDLGRVCEPGSVEVSELMAAELYSHVIHIVSAVEGQLTPERSAWDALVATFPAGTLSGAPKVRAMEIIDELEPVRRGLYGGTVGYLDFAGDLDMAIAIRTALIRDGKAYVQAGAGIVADSIPDAEAAETRNKAAAVLAAIATAETLRDVR